MNHSKSVDFAVSSTKRNTSALVFTSTETKPSTSTSAYAVPTTSTSTTTRTTAAHAHSKMPSFLAASMGDSGAAAKSADSIDLSLYGSSDGNEMDDNDDGGNDNENVNSSMEAPGKAFLEQGLVTIANPATLAAALNSLSHSSISNSGNGSSRNGYNITSSSSTSSYNSSPILSGPLDERPRRTFEREKSGSLLNKLVRKLSMKRDSSNEDLSENSGNSASLSTNASNASNDSSSNAKGIASGASAETLSPGHFSGNKSKSAEITPANSPPSSKQTTPSLGRSLSLKLRRSASNSKDLKETKEKDAEKLKEKEKKKLRKSNSSALAKPHSSKSKLRLKESAPNSPDNSHPLLDSEIKSQRRLSLPLNLTLEAQASANAARANSFGKVSSYQKLEKLGSGTYATVYKAISSITGVYVALKEIRLEMEEGYPCTALREVTILKELKHINIVTLHDIIPTDQVFTLVFEYVPQDLKQYMDNCKGIIELHNVKLFLFQLLRGLAYCHKKKVLHRDLKPQNVLIHHNGDLKLCDFGLARAKGVPNKALSNEVVTLWYRPPEIIFGATEYSGTIDVWSAGCIFAEMISGRPLFPAATTKEQIINHFKVCGTQTEDVWPGVSLLPDYKILTENLEKCDKTPWASRIPRLNADGLALIERMVCCDPSKRISADEAMKHAYFSDLDPLIHTLPNDVSIFSLSTVVFLPSATRRVSLPMNKILKGRPKSLLVPE